MSTPLSLAEVKAHLSELVARPAAVLLSVEDLESLEETIDLLSDSEAVADLITSEAELARGEMISGEELTQAVAARRRRPAS